jgi:hypothetical protein
MNETYKISALTQLKNAYGGLLYLLIVATFLIGFHLYNVTADKLEGLTMVFGITILLLIVPLIALHVNYFTINKSDVFVVDTTSWEMSFTHDSEEVKFNIDDIKLLCLYKSFAIYKIFARSLPVDEYNHAVITLKNGTLITITSLLFGKEIKLPVSRFKTKIKLNVFRWAKGPSLVFAKDTRGD